MTGAHAATATLPAAAQGPAAQGPAAQGPGAAQAGPGTEHADLTAFLAAQRQAVLDIIDGLGETALRQTVLPSGWTPLGLIEHLGRAERFWFQFILTGEVSEPPWPGTGRDDEDEDAPFTTGHPVDEVLAFYRDACTRSDAALAAARLDGAPRREVPSWMPPETHNVRTILLHMTGFIQNSAERPLRADRTGSFE